jgi:hypothetical protein
MSDLFIFQLTSMPTDAAANNKASLEGRVIEKKCAEPEEGRQTLVRDLSEYRTLTTKQWPLGPGATGKDPKKISQSPLPHRSSPNLTEPKFP